MLDWLRIGNKVVCVNDEVAAYRHLRPHIKLWSNTLDGLTKGKIYTIRDVYYDENSQTLIRLYEIIRPNRPIDNGESGFNSGRFRPLITKTIKEDLSIFTPFLDTKSSSIEDFVVMCDRRIE